MFTKKFFAGLLLLAIFLTGASFFSPQVEAQNITQPTSQYILFEPETGQTELYSRFFIPAPSRPQAYFLFNLSGSHFYLPEPAMDPFTKLEAYPELEMSSLSKTTLPVLQPLEVNSDNYSKLVEYLQENDIELNAAAESKIKRITSSNGYTVLAFVVKPQPGQSLIELPTLVKSCQVYQCQFPMLVTQDEQGLNGAGSVFDAWTWTKNQPRLMFSAPEALENFQMIEADYVFNWAEDKPPIHELGGITHGKGYFKPGPVVSILHQTDNSHVGHMATHLLVSEEVRAELTKLRMRPVMAMQSDTDYSKTVWFKPDQLSTQNQLKYAAIATALVVSLAMILFGLTFTKLLASQYKKKVRITTVVMATIALGALGAFWAFQNSRQERFTLETPFMVFKASDIKLKHQDLKIELPNLEKRQNLDYYLTGTVKPGNFAYSPIEMQWFDGDKAVLVNLYFSSDRDNWWLERAQVQVPPLDWVYYNAPKELTQTPVGQSLKKGQVVLTSDRGDQTLTLNNLDVTSYTFWPKGVSGEYNLYRDFLQTVTVIKVGESLTAGSILVDSSNRPLLDRTDVRYTLSVDNPDVLDLQLYPPRNVEKSPCCHYGEYTQPVGLGGLFTGKQAGRAVIKAEAFDSNNQVLSSYSYPVWVEPK